MIIINNILFKWILKQCLFIFILHICKKAMSTRWRWEKGEVTFYVSSIKLVSISTFHGWVRDHTYLLILVGIFIDDHVGKCHISHLKGKTYVKY